MRIPRRVDSVRVAIDAFAVDDRLFRRSFSDEVAIDFPSARAAVELVRRELPDADVSARTSAEILLSPTRASGGATVPVWLELRHTCADCGGRGEVWGEPCAGCAGDGNAMREQWIEVSVPPGVAHGDSIRFLVTPSRGPRTRVDIRVAVTESPQR